ncbi:hypothetical protein B2B12_05695 [Bordetella holmesii]|nr:hypothetical protein B2B12_05695 [Bordetella holmesii]
MCGSLEGKAYARALRAKPGTQSVLLPVGSGIEVSRYLPARLSADAKKRFIEEYRGMQTGS